MTKVKETSSMQRGLQAATVLVLLMINHAVVARHTEQLKDPNNLITYLVGLFVVIYLSVSAVGYLFRKSSQ